MKTEIFESCEKFYSREDKKINGVSPTFAELYPDYEKQNETNEACWNCSDCSGCSGLKYEHQQADKKAVNAMLNIPKIEGTHSKVAAAIFADGCQLDMSDWHSCDTTHCRGGWVVNLAGAAGKALENQTSTEFAAMMIYKESSDIRVSPTRFYEDNETAMADILRCAELEAAKQQ